LKYLNKGSIISSKTLFMNSPPEKSSHFIAILRLTIKEAIVADLD
jgi:hypothetical protein